MKKIKIKHIIWVLGILIIILRTTGINIDLTSIVFFLIISIFVLIKDLGKLKKFSGLGATFEFDNMELAEQVEQLEIKSIESEPAKIEKKTEDTGWLGFDGQRQFVDLNEIPSIDLSNPKQSLLVLANDIENILLKISKNILIKDGRFPISPLSIVKGLIDDKKIERDLYGTFSLFWDYKNKIVHHTEIRIRDNQIISIVDSGIKLLKIFKSINNNYLFETMKTK